MADQETDFDKKNLLSSVIAIPLLEMFEKAKRKPANEFDVVIDLNLDCRGGRDAAGRKVRRLLRQLLGEERASSAIKKVGNIPQYLFARLKAGEIRDLVIRDYEEKVNNDDLERPEEEEEITITPAPEPPPASEEYVHIVLDDRVRRSERAIYRIWPDFQLELDIIKSVSTVKADAAQRAFFANGDGIVWAVLDSGIEKHQHFALHGNLDVALPLAHADFTGGGDAHTDIQGHGTHVAGIIAGQMMTKRSRKTLAAAMWDYLDEKGRAQQSMESIESISGIAPRCKLLSLRVVGKDVATGDPMGNVSNLIAALTYIQEINGYGRRLLIHGVNMSLGYPFDPKWFACGQSPLCVEVDRLVRSGVVVVIAAGNAGYTDKMDALKKRSFAAGENLTIKDPGNAELAITVGSTHRDMPHTYGVSYFSSKGPTGDGRLKPDLLAPGEKILSCAAKSKVPENARSSAFAAEVKKAYGLDDIAWYIPESGTSMAAPHVSGAIAAFLSIRREFIGRPDEVKKIFLNAATDLGRERYFQGHGLVDLMRAIQSV